MTHRFGPFELDERLFELRRDGVPVPISRKAFDILVALVERRNDVVLRHELMDRVWPGVVVTKDSLAQAVMLARTALGDDPDAPTFIHTVRGRGYRFAAELATPPARASPPRPKAELLAGRVAELEVVRSVVVASRAGRGATLLVTGDLGVGKTYFVEHAVAAVAADATTIAVRCRASDAEPPLWPVVRVLRALREDDDELFPTRVEALIAGTKERAALDDPASRFALFEEALSVFARAAQRKPLVVVFDDLHLAEPHTLDFFKALASHVRSMACLVVGVHRGASVTTSPLARMVGAVLREASTTAMRLEPFSRDETMQWVAGVLGAQPHEQLVDKLFAKTRGNPLLLVQTSHVLRSRDHLRTGDMATSGLVADDAIQEAVVRRMTSAPEEVQVVLEAAGVLGVSFAVAPLASMNDMTNEEVLRALDVALGERLIAATSTTGTFTFTLPLVRDVLYRRLPPSDRARLHAKAAAALELRLEGETDHHMLGAIARHHVEAAVLGDVEGAVRWSIRAAESALTSGARESAATYARGGLAALAFAAKPDAASRARLAALAGDGIGVSS